MTRKSDTTNEQVSRSKISLKHSTNKIASTTTNNDHYNIDNSNSNTNNNTSNIDHFNMDDILNDTKNIENYKMDIIANNSISTTTRKSPIINNNNPTKNIYISDNLIKLTKQNFMMKNDISTKIFTNNKIINYNKNINEYDTKLTKITQKNKLTTNQNKSHYNPSSTYEQHNYGGNNSQSTYDTLNTLSSLQFQYKPYSIPSNKPTNFFQNTNFINNNESNVLSKSYPVSTQLTSDTLLIDRTNDDIKSSANYDSNSTSNNTVEYKSTINLCQLCNKKLPITFFTCKCGQLFCNKHRHAESHNCTFDYKRKEQLLLRKNTESIIADKVKKI